MIPNNSKIINLKENVEIKELISKNFTIHTSTIDGGLVIEWDNSKASSILYIEERPHTYLLTFKIIELFDNEFDIRIDPVINIEVKNLSILENTRFINFLKAKLKLIISDCFKAFDNNEL